MRCGDGAGVEDDFRVWRIVLFFCNFAGSKVESTIYDDGRKGENASDKV